MVEGVHEPNFLGKPHEKIAAETSRSWRFLCKAESSAAVVKLCREHGMTPLPSNCRE
ncbi:MAG: hypothetical protein ACJAVR_001487 [Paracoccaceae bacterium]|jgi:hypothetical protein